MEITVADQPEERVYKEGPESAPPADATPETHAAYEAARSKAWVVKYLVRPCDATDMSKAFKRAGVDGSSLSSHENIAVTVALAERCVVKVLEASYGGEPLTLRRKSDGVPFKPGAPEYVPLAIIGNRSFAMAAGDEAYLLARRAEAERGNSQPASV